MATATFGSGDRRGYAAPDPVQSRVASNVGAARDRLVVENTGACANELMFRRSPADAGMTVF